MNVQAAFYCASALIRSRKRTGEPIPDWLRQHHAQLDAEICGVSRPRQRNDEIDYKARQLEEQDLIGTDEVARLLNWPSRRVQRRREQLGGRLVGRGFVFDRARVIEFVRRNDAGLAIGD